MTKKEQLRDDFLQRQRAYALVFDNEMGRQVLEDLCKFCRGKESTFNADPRVHAVLEGRREVWLRLRDHLDMPPEDFIKKYLNINIQEMSK